VVLGGRAMTLSGRTMRVLRGLMMLAIAAALLFPGVPLVVDARTWCGTVLSVPVCKPVFGLLLTGMLVLAFYLLMHEAKQFKETTKHGSRSSVDPFDSAPRESDMRTIKSVALVLAKAVLLAIPLLAVHMVGVDWLFKRVGGQGIRVLESLTSFATGLGLFVIFGGIIGLDVIRLRQRQLDNERGA